MCGSEVCLECDKDSNVFTNWMALGAPDKLKRGHVARAIRVPIGLHEIIALRKWPTSMGLRL